MKLKIKIPPFLKKFNYLKILSWSLVVVFVLVIAYFANFFYQNYFGVQKNIQKIVELSEVVTPISVDIKTYNNILENIDKKNNLKVLNLIWVKNPFK